MAGVPGHFRRLAGLLGGDGVVVRAPVQARLELRHVQAGRLGYVGEPGLGEAGRGFIGTLVGVEPVMHGPELALIGCAPAGICGIARGSVAGTVDRQEIVPDQFRLAGCDVVVDDVLLGALDGEDKAGGAAEVAVEIDGDRRIRVAQRAVVRRNRRRRDDSGSDRRARGVGLRLRRKHETDHDDDGHHDTYDAPQDQRVHSAAPGPPRAGASDGPVRLAIGKTLLAGRTTARWRRAVSEEGRPAGRLDVMPSSLCGMDWPVRLARRPRPDQVWAYAGRPIGRLRIGGPAIGRRTHTRCRPP